MVGSDWTEISLDYDLLTFTLQDLPCGSTFLVNLVAHNIAGRLSSNITGRLSSNITGRLSFNITGRLSFNNIVGNSLGWVVKREQMYT